MKSYKLKLYIICIAIISIVVPVSAKNSFVLQPVRDVVQGSRFQIVFQYSTSGELNSVPTFTERPELKGCQLLYGPAQSFSQQFQMTNGQSSSQTIVQYTFTYKAETEGEVTIPSVSISVGGSNYKSKSQSFNIVKNTNPQAQSPSQPTPGASSQNSTSKVTPQDLMVNISFSKSRVYEQEPVIATIKLYVRYDKNFTIDGSSFKTNKLPVFDGFLSEDLPVASGENIERYNDKVYYTFELKRVLLFPQKAGQLKVHSGEYEITALEREAVNYGFWGSTYKTIPRHMSTATNTATLNVEALPHPKPYDFSGAVGKFSLKSELQPDMISTNEAGTYSLIIEGKGNIKYLTIPEVEFPSTFDKYTAKTDINANFNGSTYSGTYRIDYPFVPQEMGKFAIPAKSFTYFDLSKKEYVTLEAPAYDINVLRGSGSHSAVVQKTVNAEMQDIMHIHMLPEEVKTLSAPIIRSVWYWIVFTAIFMALVSATIVYRRHIKQSADIAGRKLARANRVATKRFKTAAAHMKAHRSDQFYEELAQALKGYIGDKLGIPPSQLISDTITERLTLYGANQEDAANVLDVLNECEMARFTPSQSDAAMSDVYNRAFTAIKSIEGIKK